jgi:hypothetical protein
MKGIPARYAPHFDPVIVNGIIVAWQCRYCIKTVMPNSAAAQSHVAYHTRLIARIRNDP